MTVLLYQSAHSLLFYKIKTATIVHRGDQNEGLLPSRINKVVRLLLSQTVELNSFRLLKFLMSLFVAY